MIRSLAISCMIGEQEDFVESSKIQDAMVRNQDAVSGKRRKNLFPREIVRYKSIVSSETAQSASIIRNPNASCLRRYEHEIRACCLRH